MLQWVDDNDNAGCAIVGADNGIVCLALEVLAAVALVLAVLTALAILAVTVALLVTSNVNCLRFFFTLLVAFNKCFDLNCCDAAASESELYKFFCCNTVVVVVAVVVVVLVEFNEAEELVVDKEVCFKIGRVTAVGAEDRAICGVGAMIA